MPIIGPLLTSSSSDLTYTCCLSVSVSVLLLFDFMKLSFYSKASSWITSRCYDGFSGCLWASFCFGASLEILELSAFTIPGFGFAFLEAAKDETVDSFLELLILCVTGTFATLDYPTY